MREHVGLRSKLDYLPMAFFKNFLNNNISIILIEIANNKTAQDDAILSTINKGKQTHF